MKTLTIKEILEATGGILLSGDIEAKINSISTDSRNIEPDCLFVPLMGENFDGHDFIEAAFNNGAEAAITNKDIENMSSRIIIKVEDTLLALGAIAKYYKNKFKIPFVAITGSVGKTSTKDMIASVLSQKYNVLKTSGNFNNQIGLPLTIFQLDDSHQIGIVEMGMSGFGEIDSLTKIINPDTAVITNIGVSHIEMLGSRENILKAKLEIINGMDKFGNLVLNADDELLSKVKEDKELNILYYGINSKMGIYAYYIENKGELGSKYNIKVNNKEYTVEVPVPGEHNIYNSLAAIQVGLNYKIPIEDIIKGIKAFIPGKMRQNIITIRNNVKIIEDCYNASPQSMKAAISVLADLQGRRKIAVLSDMLEMGFYTEEGHRQVGEFAAKSGIDYMFLVGNFKDYFYKGAVDAGMSKDRIYIFENKDELIIKLKKFIEREDIILVKGSRGMKMEQVVSCLSGGD